MSISRESIEKKLGFDPLYPPEFAGDPFEVDDVSPSIWAPLNTEELAFVYELLTGKKLPDEFLKKAQDK
jgi:hypothetical protein